MLVSLYVRSHGGTPSPPTVVQEIFFDPMGFLSGTLQKVEEVYGAIVGYKSFI